jgi:hypothetical protein
VPHFPEALQLALLPECQTLLLRQYAPNQRLVLVADPLLL